MAPAPASAAAAHDSAVASARALLAATTHPDTGELIPLPFRMAAHVPVNTALLVAMLSARSVPALAVTQWLNQTFNAAQFYANRNASMEAVSDGVLAASYIGAVAASVGVGAALHRWSQRRDARLAAASAVSLSSPQRGGVVGGAGTLLEARLQNSRPSPAASQRPRRPVACERA